MKSIRDLKHSRNTFMEKSLKAQERGLNDRNLQDSYFTSAVIKEYITNPVEYLNTEIFDTRQDAEKEKIKIKDFLLSTNELIDPDLLDFMPPNSILAYPMTKRAGRSSVEIFYPFFPPHLSFPAKAGEHVWVFYEVINRRKIGYWMCRKPTHRQVDDVNYTRAERINTIYPIDRVYRDKQTLVKDEEINNLVQNGGPSNGLPDNIFHDDVLRGSVSYTKDFLPEPVPNFPKKCGDLQLQGSNNASIVLGTEQFFNSDPENPHFIANLTTIRDNDLQSIREGLDNLSKSEKGDLQIRNDYNVKFANRRASGAIDLAVGKGLITYKNTSPGELSQKLENFITNPDDSRKISDSPELGVIKNYVETTSNKKLEHLEIDKTRYLRGEQESDPGSLIENKTDNCAARIYVSSVSSPDTLWARHLLPSSVSRKTTAYHEGSCAINYADHVRLYGNESIRMVVDSDRYYGEVQSVFSGDSNTGIEINSQSVYLVGRKGSRIAFSPAGSVILQSSGGASIVLKADGNVVITPGQGKNIKLGGESVDHQVLSNISLGEGPDGNIAKPIVSTALGIVGDNVNDTRGGFVPNLLVQGFKQLVPGPLSAPNTSESDLECGVDETEFNTYFGL